MRLGRGSVVSLCESRLCDKHLRLNRLPQNSAHVGDSKEQCTRGEGAVQLVRGVRARECLAISPCKSRLCDKHLWLKKLPPNFAHVDDSKEQCTGGVGLPTQ